jgi:hypothetical protein
MRLLKMGDLAERVLREMIEDCSKIEILSWEPGSDPTTHERCHKLIALASSLVFRAIEGLVQALSTAVRGHFNAQTEWKPSPIWRGWMIERCRMQWCCNEVVHRLSWHGTIQVVNQILAIMIIQNATSSSVWEHHKILRSIFVTISHLAIMSYEQWKVRLWQTVQISRSQRNMDEIRARFVAASDMAMILLGGFE